MIGRYTFGSALTRAVAICFVSRTLMSFLVALPVSSALDGSGLSALPQADRALFEPGGLILSELLRTTGPALSASLWASAWLLLLGLVLGSLPNALLFRASRWRDEPKARAWSGSHPLFARFVAFASLELLSWLVIVGLSLVLGRLLTDFAGFTEVRRDLVAGSVVLAGLGLAAGVSITLDVARAHSFEPVRLGFWKALSHALNAAGRAWSPLASGYLLTRGVGLLLVAVAARAAELLDVSREGGLRLLGVVLTHQCVLLGLSALRGAFAVRVQNTLDSSLLDRERFDRSEHSVGLGDPNRGHDA